MLIARGESPKYICDQLGHSSVQVTFDTYGHLFPQAREEAAAKFQKAMLAGRKKAFGSKTGRNGKSQGSQGSNKLTIRAFILISVGGNGNWLRGKDLNLRPLGYEPNELPDCSTPHLYPIAIAPIRQ